MEATSHRGQHTRARLRSAGVVLLATLLLGLGACSSRGPSFKSLNAGEEVAAERDYAAVLDAYGRGDVARARSLSFALLDAQPGFRGAAELRRRLAESYMEESDWEPALDQLGRLLEDYPRSDERWPAIVLKAQALAGAGRGLDAATGLDRALDYWPDNAWQSRAEGEMASLLDGALSAVDLQEFMARRPHSRRLPRAKLALAQRRMEAGEESAARTLLQDVASGDEPGLRVRARQLLAELDGAPGLAPGQAAPVRTGLVGVLAPLSGRYQVYGEAFLDGAQLALNRYNEQTLGQFELLSADSEGDPVRAALAARRLIRRDGVAALLGGVLSNSTAAAAVEANASEVPLLSPAATAENIHEIGPWVFQNNITSEAQVLALARVAITDLLGARFAVLYPKQGNGMALAKVFEDTVYGLGGEIVASVSYEVGMTDFSEPLEQIRLAQPEVLFMPGEVEQLVLLVPQLAYHDVYAQLLGNESWNSRRLLRLGGDGLEGALFPSDLLLKRDRGLYRDFLRLYERRYASSVNPVAARGFLGMTTLLEVMAGGAEGRGALRDQLALRTADTGDEAARRELLAAQVTLMTVQRGEIRPYDERDAPAERETAAPDAFSNGFIDGP